MHPLRKLYVGSKNVSHLFNGLDVLYHHAKFGEDRTTRACCRCENVFFLSCSESGGLCIRLVHSSNKYCVTVYGLILMRFSLF